MVRSFSREIITTENTESHGKVKKTHSDLISVLFRAFRGSESSCGSAALGSTHPPEAWGRRSFFDIDHGRGLGRIDALPEVPTRDRAIRPPVLGQRVAFAGPGKLGQAVTVHEADAHAQVACGEHIGPVEARRSGTSRPSRRRCP